MALASERSAAAIAALPATIVSRAWSTSTRTCWRAMSTSARSAADCASPSRTSRAHQPALEDRPRQREAAAPVPDQVVDLAAVVGQPGRRRQRRAVAAGGRLVGQILRAQLGDLRGDVGPRAQRLVDQRLERRVLAGQRRRRGADDLVAGGRLDAHRLVQQRARGRVVVLGVDQRHLGVRLIGARLQQIDLGARADLGERLDLLDVLVLVGERLARDADRVARRPRREERGPDRQVGRELRRPLACPPAPRRSRARRFAAARSGRSPRSAASR